MAGQVLHEQQLGLHQSTVPQPAAQVQETGSDDMGRDWEANCCENLGKLALKEYPNRNWLR